MLPAPPFQLLWPGHMTQIEAIIKDIEKFRTMFCMLFLLCYFLSGQLNVGNRLTKRDQKSVYEHITLQKWNLTGQIWHREKLAKERWSVKNGSDQVRGCRDKSYRKKNSHYIMRKSCAVIQMNLPF